MPCPLGTFTCLDGVFAFWGETRHGAAAFSNFWDDVLNRILNVLGDAVHHCVQLCPRKSFPARGDFGTE